MIELRWPLRETTELSSIYDKVDRVTKRTLQYRHKTENRYAGQPTHDYTEWMDAPEETSDE